MRLDEHVLHDVVDVAGAADQLEDQRADIRRVQAEHPIELERQRHRWRSPARVIGAKRQFPRHGIVSHAQRRPRHGESPRARGKVRVRVKTDVRGEDQGPAHPRGPETVKPGQRATFDGGAVDSPHAAVVMLATFAASGGR